MVIVKLQGGLGNQMFQYAAGRALAEKHGTTLKLDLTALKDRSRQDIVLREFDLDIFTKLHCEIATKEESEKLTRPFKIDFLNKVVRRLPGTPTHFVETSYAYQEKYESLRSDVYLEGYWQSEKYFKSIENLIRSDFSFDALTVGDNELLKKRIRETDSVCLNVRRGDFVTLSANTLGFVGLEYYHQAIEHIGRSVKKPHYYVFSDEIDWCRENLHFQQEVTFVDHSSAGPKFADYLQLMSSCKHFIIPNSSFAWWAAWLSENPDKIVISPLKYFANSAFDSSDIAPPSWIRL